MKNTSIIIIFLLMALVGQSQSKVVDGVAAVVAEDVILVSDLETQYHQIRMSQKIYGGKQLYCDILENLVIQKMLLYYAKEVDSLKVSDEHVSANMDQRMRYFVSQMGSEEKLEEYFNKSIEDIKDEFRDMIREQMLVQQEQEKISERVKITPAEVRQFYDAIPKDSLPQIPLSYALSHIVKEPPVSAHELNETREKLLALRKRIVEGESFSALARLYSEDGSSAKGGELGFYGRGDLFPEFEAVAFNLQKGQVSEVVKTKAGFHIIQLIERRGDLINVRHILLSPKPSITDIANAKSSLDSIAMSIRNGDISFEEAAKKYSSAPDAINGGIMVNEATKEEFLREDELEPSLSYLLKGMSEGDLSNATPMVTRDNQQAFRIVMIRTRLLPHKANLLDDFNTIKEWALEKKKSENIKEWIKERRHDVYVRVFPPYEECDFNRRMNDNR